MKLKLTVSTIFLLTGAGSAQVLSESCRQSLAQQAGIFPGANGYYFYTDELSGNWIGQPFGQSVKAIPAFKAIHEDFQSQGIQLILLPVPPRPMLLGDMVRDTPGNKKYSSSYERSQYQQFIKALENAGIKTINLLNILDKEQNAYFLKDIHWTPQAARKAASAVATIIKADPGYSELPKGSFLSRNLGTQSKPLTAQYAVQFLKSLCNQSIQTDTTEVYRTEKAEASFSSFRNVGDVEDMSHRWLLGPAGDIEFISAKDQNGVLRLALSLFFENQTISLKLNGKVVGGFKVDKLNPQTRRKFLDIPINAKEGVNTISISADIYNGKPLKSLPDQRPLALDINSLEISFADGTIIDAIKAAAGGAGASLLGDDFPPVVVVGSSFSDISFNLVGFLQEASGLDGLNMSTGGGGVFDSLRSLLQGNYLKESPPKYIVWEFPMFGNAASTFDDFIPLVGAAQGCKSDPLKSLKVRISDGKSIVPGSASSGARTVRLNLPTPEVTQLSLSGSVTPQWRATVTNSLRLSNRGEIYLPVQYAQVNLSQPFTVDVGMKLDGEMSVEYCR